MPRTDPFLSALGAVIASRRKRLELTQQALADRLGTTQKRVWEFERGQRRDVQVVATFVPLAEALGMSTTELMAAISVEMRDQALKTDPA